MMGDCGRVERRTCIIALRLHRQENLYRNRS